MTSKPEKDKSKVFQEKLQLILCQLLREDDNKFCVDCDTQGPRWASWNLGIFLCIRCAGIHRNLGVHISRVKSVNLDSWTPEQVAMMKEMGNSRARAVYEANLPDNYRRPLTDSALEMFIRQKYEEKKYIAREFVPPKLDAVIRSLQLDDSNDSSTRSSAANSSKTARPRPASTVVETPSRPRQQGAELAKPAVAAAAAGGSGGMPHIQTDPQIHAPKTDLLDMDLLTPPVANKSSSEGDLLGISFAASVNVTDPFHQQQQQAVPQQQQQLMQPEVDLFGDGSASEQKRQTNKENILKLYSSGPPPSAMGQMGHMGMMQQQAYGMAGPMGMRPMNGMAAYGQPPPAMMGGWGGAMPGGMQPNPMMMRPASSMAPQPASGASYNFVPGTFGQPYYQQQQVMPNAYAPYPASGGAPPMFPVNQTTMMANGNRGPASNSSGQTLSTHLWQ